MPLLTSQRIAELYNNYRQVEVTFTKAVSAALGLIPREVYLKCLDYQWRCVIYSSSMINAKILLNAGEDIAEIFRKANHNAILRYSFQEPDSGAPVSFFINSKVAGCVPYNRGSARIQFVSLRFTHQPPEDLVGLLGVLVETSANAKNRAEERLPLTEETIKSMGLLPKASALVVNEIPRPCILRGLSFAGAQMIISGLGKFLIGKPAAARIQFEDLPALLIPGTILRSDPVEGRQDLSTVGFRYAEGKTPLPYRLKINDQMIKHKPPRTRPPARLRPPGSAFSAPKAPRPGP